MKRIAFALLFFWGILLYNGSACADMAAAVVLEEKTGRVLYAVNDSLQLPMASTTKIMTAMIALENCSLSEMVTATDNAYGVPGTSIYLEKGETLSMEQMLYGLMLASGNDAAVAIAEHVAGSVSAFCDMMNARAMELGCTGTHFSTPHGLPAENHYTTALDLALIAREAMKNPVFRQIVSTQRATIPWQNHSYDRVLNNKNRLLSSYEGALGIKTGYTRAAGRCLAFAAERDGMTLIGVVLNSPDWFTQSEALLDHVFAGYEMYEALPAETIVRTLPVIGGVEQTVDILLNGDVAAPIPKGAVPQLMISLPDELHAGFDAGEQVGWMTLELEGETLCSTALTTSQAVPERTFLTGFADSIANWLLLSR